MLQVFLNKSLMEEILWNSTLKMRKHQKGQLTLNKHKVAVSWKLNYDLPLMVLIWRTTSSIEELRTVNVQICSYLKQRRFIPGKELIVQSEQEKR